MTIEKDFPDKQDPRYYYKQTLRPEKQIREPNTITKYYGRHDTGNRCKVGEGGSDHFTHGAIPVSYTHLTLPTTPYV